MTARNSRYRPADAGPSQVQLVCSRCRRSFPAALVWPVNDDPDLPKLDTCVLCIFGRLGLKPQVQAARWCAEAVAHLKATGQWEESEQ